MSVCVNGRWHADACRCFKFWTGLGCDRRLCARGAGILTPRDGLCRCRPGFGGEFCQYEICRHDHQWYCNATEMAPPTIWDEDEPDQGDAQPTACSAQVLESWFKPPDEITPAWYCHCGTGRRDAAVNDTEILSPDCDCDAGHFGKFCESDICVLNKTVWHPESGFCVDPPPAKGTVMGFLGYDINSELAGTTILVFTVIAFFFILGRWYVSKADKEARQAGRRGYSLVPKESAIASNAESCSSSLLFIWKSSEPKKRKQTCYQPPAQLASVFDYKDFYEVKPTGQEAMRLMVPSDSGGRRHSRLSACQISDHPTARSDGDQV